MISYCTLVPPDTHRPEDVTVLGLDFGRCASQSSVNQPAACMRLAAACLHYDSTQKTGDSGTQAPYTGPGSSLYCGVGSCNSNVPYTTRDVVTTTFCCHTTAAVADNNVVGTVSSGMLHDIMPTGGPCCDHSTLAVVQAPVELPVRPWPQQLLKALHS